MKIPNLHPWNLSYTDAIALQKRLRGGLLLEWDGRDVRLVAGADVSFSKRDEKTFAVVVVMEYPDMRVVEKTYAVGRIEFPYIPGLLSFREAPVLIEAFRKIKNVPDLVMFDGQGIAHPRFFGLAAHMGYVLDLPSVGCAKSRLVGEHEEVGERAGEWVPLHFRGKVVGAVVRTREGSAPLYISPGHKIDVEHAVEFTLNCCRGGRLPEPTRVADSMVRKLRDSAKSGKIEGFEEADEDGGEEQLRLL